MAAMAIMNAASTMQSANLTTTATSVAASGLSSSSVRFGPLRLTSNAIANTKPTRSVVLVRAAGNPERIDNFFDGAKSDASKNAKNFGDAVAQKAGEVQETVKDVGRDMGAKAQEAVDAASGKVDEAGDKAREVGDEVKSSTKDTLDSATDNRNGQSVVDKATNAASNVGGNVKQNIDQGTGAVKNAADDASKDAKRTADRL
ncbi:hypothetical protein M758_2G070100 [Ceratodon purpureus]|nr:hypothetical protein M758_2G070100 [Ceratodon purpureus]